MTKTTVYMPDDTKRRLALEARRRGVSEASLIRDAIEALLGEDRPRPTVPLFRSGRRGVAHDVDGELDRRLRYMSVVVADTSGLLAALDEDKDEHTAARDAVNVASVVVLSPFVLAELDYLVMKRRGVQAQLALLGEVADRCLRSRDVELCGGLRSHVTVILHSGG